MEGVSIKAGHVSELMCGCSTNHGDETTRDDLIVSTGRILRRLGDDLNKRMNIQPRHHRFGRGMNFLMLWNMAPGGPRNDVAMDATLATDGVILLIHFSIALYAGVQVLEMF